MMIKDRAAVALRAKSDGVNTIAITRKFQTSIGRFLQGTPLGVGKLNASGQWFEVNKNLCHMLGYGRARLLTKTIEELTHPDDWPRQKALFDKILNGKKDSYEIDKRYVCRSGCSLWVSETVEVVRDDLGSCLNWICLIKVNEVKRSEELFNLTVELSSNAMAMTDQSGKIVLVNPRIEEIFGYRQSELLGKSIEILIPDLSRESHNLQVQPMPDKCHSFGQRKNGTFFPAEVTLRGIETGRGTWIITSIGDNREPKQSEQGFLKTEVHFPEPSVALVSIPGTV